MKNIGKYAQIIKMICDRTDPGKKVLQKLFYLIEQNRVKLELNFSIHFFGPYSSFMDDSLHILEARDIININTSGRTHKISMNTIGFESYKFTDEYLYNQLNCLEDAGFLKNKNRNPSSIDSPL